MKPDNCLFGEDGHLRLSDFGIAAQLSNDRSTTSGRAGTPGYQGNNLPEPVAALFPRTHWRLFSCSPFSIHPDEMFCWVVVDPQPLNY